MRTLKFGPVFVNAPFWVHLYSIHHKFPEVRTLNIIRNLRKLAGYNLQMAELTVVYLYWIQKQHMIYNDDDDDDDEYLHIFYHYLTKISAY